MALRAFLIVVEPPVEPFQMRDVHGKRVLELAEQSFGDRHVVTAVSEIIDERSLPRYVPNALSHVPASERQMVQ